MGAPPAGEMADAHARFGPGAAAPALPALQDDHGTTSGLIASRIAPRRSSLSFEPGSKAEGS